MNISRVSLLGVQVSAIHMDLALGQLETWLAGDEQNYVCVTPAHTLMDCYRQAKLRAIYNRAGMVTPDGMAVVWLLRLKGHKNVGRVYGPDLLQAACSYGLDRGWRHYFLGGAPGVPEKLVARLQKQCPGLQVVGHASPPFGPLTTQENEGIIAAVNASQADIVWVGLGSPRQETWMSNHLGKVQAAVMVGVGAAFDFLSGTKPQAPRWMQRAGLEWLFRLASEPQRLWPRYRQYPLFVWLVLRELIAENWSDQANRLKTQSHQNRH